VALSMNSGSPVVEADRRSPVGRALLKLTEQFETSRAGDATRAWWKRAQP
jgi:hypothetical protein